MLLYKSHDLWVWSCDGMAQITDLPEKLDPTDNKTKGKAFFVLN